MSAAEDEQFGPGYMTKKQAAAYYQVSVDTLERAQRAGMLRFIGGGRGGPDVRYRLEWLEEWARNRGRGKG